MRKIFHYYTWHVCFLCLLLSWTNSKTASAAVTEAYPGETVTGTYAVIVNTDTSSPQSTGTLIFTESPSVSNMERKSSVAPIIGHDIQNTEEYTTAAASDISYSIGTEKNIYTSGGTGKTYVCIGIGAHCYVWMEKTLKQSYDAAGKTNIIAEDMAETYDGQPYQMLYAMSGGNCCDKL